MLYEEIKVQKLSDPGTYNFEVADCHAYYVSDSKIFVHNFCLNDGIGSYRQRGGHHPISEKAFDGVKGYNADDALTISSSKLSEFGVTHSAITGQQHKLYADFAKTGKKLTMKAMKDIEIQSMVNAGIPLNYAKNAVNMAAKQLASWGIKAPKFIPWS